MAAVAPLPSTSGATIENRRALLKALEKRSSKADVFNLVAGGAASGAADSSGVTPLHVAARFSASNDVLQELVAANPASLWTMVHPGLPFQVLVPDGFEEGSRLVVNTSMSGKMTCRVRLLEPRQAAKTAL